MMVGNIPFVIPVAKSVKDCANLSQNTRIAMIYSLIQKKMKVNQ